jgi:hypothetical protein
MLATFAADGESSFASVDLNARRPGIREVNDANASWNVQTLNLMARTGMVRLKSAIPPDPERREGEDERTFDLRRESEYESYFRSARVEILHPGHRDETVWKSVIEPERQRSFASGAASLSVLRDMLEGRSEFSEQLAAA